MSGELETLIAEQERDAKRGDRVYSLSLDAPFGKDETLIESLAVVDGVTLLPRPVHRVHRARGLIGHKARRPSFRFRAPRRAVPNQWVPKGTAACPDCGQPKTPQSARCSRCAGLARRAA